MPEQIGGREHRWGWPDLLKFGKFLHFIAVVLGWSLLLALPVATCRKAFENCSKTSHVLKEFSLTSESAEAYLNAAYPGIVLVLCFIWCVFTYVGFSAYFFSLFKMSRPEKSSDGKSASAPADGVTPKETPTQKPKSNETPSAPSSPDVETPDQARKKAELERRKQEQERRQRIETARKDFKAKCIAFRDSIQSRYDIKEAGGSLDFSDKIKSSPLKITMREGCLRPYMSWDAEAMILKVGDPHAFNNDREASFVLELSDPTIAADAELRDEIKSDPINITLRAKFPWVAEKFFEWKAKTPSAVRLDNAKQGQDVDYDLKAILGFDASWAVWKDASGLGSLKADFDTNRLQGAPTVGNDNKIRVVFACRGCEGVVHEFDLLLTCNMDAEQLWSKIESDDSDKPAVISPEDSLRLAKMADAVRSTANSYEVAKPDDLFAKPHRVSRRMKANDFDLAYASIRGRSHVKGGSFREDHVEARFFRDGKALAIVVSDGAGSASLSRRGSHIVATVGVRSLIELGERLLGEPDALDGRSQSAVDGFAAVVKAICGQIGFEAECIKEQSPEFQSKEMYATFLAALVLPRADGQVLLTYSAGDGAIGLGLAGEASGLKCVPDHGQSAGQTLFILNKGADDAEKRLRFTKLPPAYALLLMSDGVSDPCIPHGEEEKPETWERLANELKPLAAAEPLNQDADKEETFKDKGALCAWLDSYHKGHHDDRTIAAIFHKLT